MAVNLPFRTITSAALRLHGDGTADIPLSLRADQRLSYLAVWPHARPRRSRPQPMLRCAPDGAGVARILPQALAAATAQGMMEQGGIQQGLVGAPAPAVAPTPRAPWHLP
jgi:hypothetical protein